MWIFLPLHTMYICSLALRLRISSGLILSYFLSLSYCLNRFQDLLTYFKVIFYFSIIFSAYFGIYPCEFSNLEVHILPFYLVINRIFRVKIFFQVFNKTFKCFCKILPLIRELLNFHRSRPGSISL